MRKQAALIFVSMLAAACGGSGSTGAGTGTGTAPPASPAAPGRLTAENLPGVLNMVLHAQLDGATLGQAPGGRGVSVAGSGNWGYTSPDGRRFALTGTSGGLSIVEVSDPARPRVIALVEGATSAWREVKTYKQYAYVTTEAQTGLDIIDLGDPDRPRKVGTRNETFQSAHTLWVDVQTGLLYANGTRSGMHVLDLEPDPENPRPVSVFNNYYIHDAYVRNNVLFAAAIRDGFLSLLDVSRPEAIRETARFATGGRFTHNAWPSRDGRYVFTTDEVPDRPVETWDISDPARPRKVFEYISRPGTIPHNVLVDGDHLLLSHYTEGVQLLDVQDPLRPRVLGIYDTFAGPTGGFHGNWGAYVFPGSNLILASDIEGGLFVVEYTGP